MPVRKCVDVRSPSKSSMFVQLYRSDLSCVPLLFKYPVNLCESLCDCYGFNLH